MRTLIRMTYSSEASTAFALSLYLLDSSKSSTPHASARGKLVLRAVDPEVRPRERQVEQCAVVGRFFARVGVGPEEATAQAHPRHGHYARPLQGRDEPHEEAHHDLLLLRRRRGEALLYGVRPRREPPPYLLTHRGEAQRRNALVLWPGVLFYQPLLLKGAYGVAHRGPREVKLFG